MFEKIAKLIKEQGIIEAVECNEGTGKIEIILRLSVEGAVAINADVTDLTSAEQKVARWVAQLTADASTCENEPKVCCKDCAYSREGINVDWLRCTYDHYRLLVSPTSTCGCGRLKEVV